MYGLYLYRSSQPEMTGTYGECKKAIDSLSDAERMHGWTIKPFRPAPKSRTVSQTLWAIVGTGILLFGHKPCPQEHEQYTDVQSLCRFCVHLADIQPSGRLSRDPAALIRVFDSGAVTSAARLPLRVGK